MGQGQLARAGEVGRDGGDELAIQGERTIEGEGGQARKRSPRESNRLGGGADSHRGQRRQVARQGERDRRVGGIRQGDRGDRAPSNRCGLDGALGIGAPGEVRPGASARHLSVELRHHRDRKGHHQGTFRSLLQLIAHRQGVARGHTVRIHGGQGQDSALLSRCGLDGSHEFLGEDQGGAGEGRARSHGRQGRTGQLQGANGNLGWNREHRGIDDQGGTVATNTVVGREGVHQGQGRSILQRDSSAEAAVLDRGGERQRGVRANGDSASRPGQGRAVIGERVGAARREDHPVGGAERETAHAIRSPGSVGKVARFATRPGERSIDEAIGVGELPGAVLHLRGGGLVAPGGLHHRCGEFIRRGEERDGLGLLGEGREVDRQVGGRKRAAQGERRVDGARLEGGSRLAGQRTGQGSGREGRPILHGGQPRVGGQTGEGDRPGGHGQGPFTRESGLEVHRTRKGEGGAGREGARACQGEGRPLGHLHRDISGERAVIRELQRASLNLERTISRDGGILKAEDACAALGKRVAIQGQRLRVPITSHRVEHDGVVNDRISGQGDIKELTLRVVGVQAIALRTARIISEGAAIERRHAGDSPPIHIEGSTGIDANLGIVVLVAEVVLAAGDECARANGETTTGCLEITRDGRSRGGAIKPQHSVTGEGVGVCSRSQAREHLSGNPNIGGRGGEGREGQRAIVAEDIAAVGAEHIEGRERLRGRAIER